MSGNEAWRWAGRAFGHLLFWGWNLLLVGFVGLGLGPVVLVGLFAAVLAGLIPWHMGAVGLAIALLPVAAILVGWRLRRDPGRLLSLLYGVEFPILLALLVRLFAIGVLTAPTALALAVLAVGALGLLRTLLHGPAERGRLAQAARLVAASAWLAGGLWVAAWAALYAVPIAAWIAWELLQVRWLAFAWNPSELLAAATALGFLAATALALLVFPVAAFGIAIRAWQVVHRATAARLGRAPAAALAGGTLALLALGFALTARQPQAEAFARLDAATSDPARAEALAHSERIRAGLVNARLADERWLDPDPGILRELWGGLTWPERLGAALQHPFVYHPVGASAAEDRAEARARYAAFFDRPIERGERETLLRAARATWSWESAEAGLLEIGERKVHLARQEVTVEPHGDLARVTVHDVYRNRTFDAQEVLVSFSLPETAAVTGLWLGTEDDRARAFRFVVAPRGAAQEVYEGERVQRRDPALVEQVGPRQYRLRAYPVLPREATDERWSFTGEGPELHLWLEVIVPVQQGAEGPPFFPLPRATEVRNLFWDAASARTFDGAEVSPDAWLPDAAPAPGTSPGAHLAVVGGLAVRATPAGPLAPRRLGRLAVLVDGTRSMEAHRDGIDQALWRLGAVADELVVICAVEQRYQPCPGYAARDALFWGAIPLEAQIAAAAAHAGDAEVLVVLTDEDGYETAVAADPLPELALPPLWLVHFGGFPRAYADWTLDHLHETGGGVAASVDELLVRLADPLVADGWRWEVIEAPEDAPAAGPFAAVAARRAIAALDARARGHALPELDRLHRIAVEAEVVTPWSSMLVLVDDRQRERLAAAEQRDDRFAREVIDAPVEVTAAPEPATWALLGVGGALLAFGRRRAARAEVRSGP